MLGALLFRSRRSNLEHALLWHYSPVKPFIERRVLPVIRSFLTLLSVTLLAGTAIAAEPQFFFGPGLQELHLPAAD